MTLHKVNMSSFERAKKTTDVFTKNYNAKYSNEFFIIASLLYLEFAHFVITKISNN